MKELEDIILEKEYFELSTVEKAALSEMVANEEEYADMKWFLNQTKATVKANAIEPSENLKAVVFAELGQPANKRIWLNGGAAAGAAPTKKKIYQMPMFQIGIAACLVVGFLLFTNPFEADKELALNESSTISGEEEVGNNVDGTIVNGQKELVDLEKSTGGGESTVDTRNQLAEDGIIDELNEKVPNDIPLRQTEEQKQELESNVSSYDAAPSPDYWQRLDAAGSDGDATGSTVVLDEEITTTLANNRDEKGKILEQEADALDAADDFAWEDSNKEGKLKDYKNNDGANNAPGTELAGGVVTTGSLEVAEEVAVADKSSINNVGQAFSKKKDEKSKVAESPAMIPVPNAVSIADTKELKTLFFTVP